VRNRVQLPIRIAAAVVSFAVLLALSGCAGVSTGSSQKQPPPGQGQATLAVSPTSLSFPATAVGNSTTLPLSVTNTSNSVAANISQLAISGTGYSLVSPPALPTTLNAGQQLNLTIKFAPQSGGTLNGNLQIVSDASNSPINVPISGTGVAQGQLAVSPSSVDFGNVMVGNNGQAQGQLTAGSSDITVTSVAWNGTGYSVSGITFPVTVPAGKSVNFTVTFAPQGTGTATGSVSFYSNASNSPAVQTWTGVGTQQQKQSHTVALSWNPSTSQVIGYNVYRGKASGGPYGKLNSSVDPSTAYTDSTVQNGSTYYYVTTAVNSQGQESTYSNEAQAVVPQN
jgi:hypothetical protein